MSTKKKSADAPSYEPERLYRVKLARIAEGPGGVMLSPAHQVQLKGKHIAALGDAVTEAEAMPDAE